MNEKKSCITKFEHIIKLSIMLLILIITIILLFIFKSIFIFAINRTKNSQNIRFIICNAPSHNNYGDDAILISTQEFLKTYFPQNKQIIINYGEVLKNERLIKYIINENDIIIISGGGQFGLYDYIIDEHVKIVKTFPNNQIILFPCSIFYNKNRKKTYEKFLQIFNNHTHLTLFTRDNTSYQTALNLFTTKEIYSVPDIVTRLNLNFLNKNNKREGILLILRTDELLLTNHDRIFIKDMAHKYFNNNIYEKDPNLYQLLPNNTRKK